MYHLHGPIGEYGPHACDDFVLTEDTKRLRRYMEDYIAGNGRPPTFAEMKNELNLSQQAIWDSLHQLHLAVQIMFVPGTQTIAKMPPFAFYPTRHRVYLDDGREFWTGCAGEASAFSGQFLGHETRIDSMCPVTWETITTVWKDGKYISHTPETAVLHIGVHPTRWHEEMAIACENINFFKSKEHVLEWEAAIPERAGMTLPIPKCADWVSFISQIRYHDYDRGPDYAGPKRSKQMFQFWRELGADLSNWE